MVGEVRFAHDLAGGCAVGSSRPAGCAGRPV